MELINVADIVEANGRTVRQNNMAKGHAIPVGELVEVKWHDWFGDGVCWKVHARMWVISHDRDCDGTPLYAISRWRDPVFAKQVRDLHNGFTEDQLTVIERTNPVIRGENALTWSPPAEDA